ncbi:MAG: class I SAM-dependent methyltransferase [Ilumatobacteraceae bacterium]
MRARARLRSMVDAWRPRRTGDVQPGDDDLLAFARRLEQHGLVPALSDDVEQWAPFLRFAPPGHYYSPIPRHDAITEDAGRIWAFTEHLPGIDPRRADQRELVARIAETIGADRLAEVPTSGRRYSTANVAFGSGDATMLHGMLRLHRPARVVEIGSGHSSALILDVVEAHLPETSVTFVEPYPELLRSLMRPGDESRCRIVERRAQDLPPDVLAELTDGDILFIDSTHVVRTGSDVCRLILDVLPALAPGVLVHVHDIFWPFEMLRAWVEEGRQWAECYLLRAFLTSNPEWEIVLFNNYLATFEPELLERTLPQFMANSGGSIWLRRRTDGDRA